MAIQRLILRDFVIVRSLELELSSGFTALTGETGAGKSILIDAIQMALGERANAGVVREGANKAEIAIEFDRTPAVDAWLLEAGFDFGADGDTHLLIRRTVETTGKSRAWINGGAATAAQLRALADYLVDIHGQHAWAMLTRPHAVRDLLDAYANIDKRPLALAWDTWRQCHAQFELAKSSSAQQTQEQERLHWQISEVAKLAPLADEWEEINQEHTRLANAQTLIDAATHAATLLDGGQTDTGSHALAHIHKALQGIDAQSHIEQGFQSICQELISAAAQVEDASRNLQAYLRKTDLDPARLLLLDSRMVDWLSLARRFKCQPEALHALLHSWHAQLSQLKAMSDLDKLETEAHAAYAAFETAAKLISKKRLEASPQLCETITKAMQELGMEGGSFDILLSRLDQPASHGFESAEFLVAGHAGASPKPIGKVASGGELSRIALAIAVTTSKLGNAPTLIFDEVDAGIGGATAQTVGKLMAQLGADRQVLAVTHLPQVASRAHQHGVVSKSSLDKANTDLPCSHIELVTGQARIAEIARMLGGEVITQAARIHAAEMLEVI